MEGMVGGTMKKWLNFRGNLGLLRWVNEQKNTMIAVASRDRGAGNDPEALGLALHYHGPTFIDTYCQAATNLVDWDWGQYGGNDLPRPRR